MIKANPQTWYKTLFRIYNRYYLLPGHFSVIRRKGTIDPPLAADGKRPPVIYVANHTNWWDGMVAYENYIRASSYQHFIMMDEKQLRQFRFFTRIGVFSIDKTKGSAIIETLEYAADLLRQQHAVWIFPQGEIEHLEKRPLQFSSGVAFLLERCPDAVVVPVAMYYSFGFKQKPEVDLWFGEPLRRVWADLSRKQITGLLSETVEHQLDQLRERYMVVAPLIRELDDDPAFVTVYRSRTTDEWFLIAKKWVRRWFMRSRS